MFDWDGHALERITTDWKIRAMCVGADGTIYAALYDNLSRVFLGRIVPSEGEEAPVSYTHLTLPTTERV